MDKYINIFLLILLTFLTVAGAFLTYQTKETKINKEYGPESNYNNAEILELTAKAGYFPEQLLGKSNKETILRIKTANSFDCSTALVLPKLNIQKNLPPTGLTDIKIPPQKTGTKLAGTCSMGMYNFEITFN